MEKISELRRQGLWLVRRLPKASEPPHSKAHWDYVLEEMQWLANDFAQERKWKKAGARKVTFHALSRELTGTKLVAIKKYETVKLKC